MKIRFNETDEQTETRMMRLQAKRDRQDAEIDRRESRRYDKAGEFIGELCREGRTVLYIWRGGYKEGDRDTLIKLLVRRGFIR